MLCREIQLFYTHLVDIPRQTMKKTRKVSELSNWKRFLAGWKSLISIFFTFTISLNNVKPCCIKPQTLYYNNLNYYKNIRSRNATPCIEYSSSIETLALKKSRHMGYYHKLIIFIIYTDSEIFLNNSFRMSVLQFSDSDFAYNNDIIHDLITHGITRISKFLRPDDFQSTGHFFVHLQYKIQR